ncbi:serine hydrolase [Patescibacteria group bacterium]|nr:serine hydrolase [Patescibacteria group bacterium]MBU1673856.1 serine hydrolase [Patescibacteria group bacterium]MBU1963233.1 serine hydrolase [Patescibacteria group bacterium]
MKFLKFVPLACLLLVFLFPQSSFASTKTIAITKASAIVDEYTAQEKGITLSTKRMSVGIPAGTFNEAFKVRLKKPPKKLQNRTKKKMIGPSLRLQINSNQDGMLEKPVHVALKYKSKKNKKKTVAYYDRSGRKWRKLDTRLDTDKKIAYADIYFPFVRLTVLQSRKKKQEPRKESDYSDFYYGLDAGSAVVIDAKSGAVLFDKNKDQKRSIASLTKLMTAQIFLDSGKNMQDTVTYSSSCNRECVCLYVDDGETMKVQDLFYTTLVGSANNAAVALSKTTGYSDQDFVAKMNEKARDWNLSDTQFVEPSGLDQNNMSTAHEYAKLAKKALKEMDILQASTTKYYEFWTQNTGEWHGITNQNKLLYRDLYVLGTKTGFTYEAMFCLMVKARQGDEEVIVVILGNPSYADSANEVYDLTKWAFDNYDW